MAKLSAEQIEQLATSHAYSEYIINNCHGDRLICNGDTLVEAIEDQYLWEEFLDSIGVGLEDCE